jgi:hypothetical protein
MNDMRSTSTNAALTCGVVFVVARHVPVVPLCFAGFPRDGVIGREPSRNRDFQGHGGAQRRCRIALELQQKPESLPHRLQHLGRNYSQRTAHQALP